MSAAPGPGPSDDPDDDRGIPFAVDHFERPKWGARVALLGLLVALGLVAACLSPGPLLGYGGSGLNTTLPEGNAAGTRRLEEDVLADLRSIEGDDSGAYKAAYVSLAAYPYMCLSLPAKLETGSMVAVRTCPEDRNRAAKFLVPVGIVGALRPAAAPHLCLDSPKGFDLRLWSCEEVRLRYDIERIRFLLRPEAPTWLKYDNFDVEDKHDAEQMSAADLEKVMRRVEDKGYTGFSVWHGQAWIKNVDHLTKENMNFNGNGVKFYMYRPRGDFTIRAATDPGLCVGVPSRIPIDGEVPRLMPCGLPGMYALLLKTRFILHYSMLDEVETERLQEELSRHRQNQRTTSTRPLVLTTTTTGPRPPKRRPVSRHVRVSMTITNVDYDLFMAHPHLKGEVSDVIKQEVAEAAGHTVTPDCVDLRFSQGSVKVESSINVPEGTPEDSVIAKMKTSGGTLKAAIADRITALPDIGAVTLGQVGVQETEESQPFYAAPLHWLRSLFNWHINWPHWHPEWHWPGLKINSGLWPWIVGGFLGGGLVALCIILACLQRTQLRSFFESRSARSTPRSGAGGKTPEPSSALSIFQTRMPKVDINVPGVWRLGRITDLSRPNNTSYDVDLDSTGGGRTAIRALEYSPVIGGW